MLHASRSGQSTPLTRFIVLGIDNVIRLGTTPDKDALTFGLPFLLRLKNTCTKTEAKIVISSSWRTLYTPDELKDIIWSKFSIKMPIQEPTPRLVRDAGESDDSLRQREVQLWITRAKSRGIKMHGIAVVDRFSFIDPLNRYHVEAKNGFTKDVANTVENLLLRAQ